MADDPTNSNPASGNASPTATNPPAGQTPPAPPAADNTKMAEELGRLKAENEAYKTYQQQVDPVLATLYDRSAIDKETFQKILDAHNKRMGITPQGNSQDIPPAPPSPEIQRIERKVDDSRNADVVREVNSFQVKHGIDKLEEEAKKDINTRVGAMLMDMVDPMGNKKDLRQVLEDIPLAKLPKLLDDAYFLVTKDQQIQEAKNQGKQEANQESLGVIGSLPSESISSDNLTLTTAQKKVADSLGISHDKYLARVKEISTRPTMY